MTAKLTIIITAFNEESNIREAIACSQFADEVIVVDSFSTDATPQIAVEMGAKLLQNKYVSSANQKNWTIPQATHEWVAILDSDERFSPALRDEIVAFINQPGPYAGLRIFRSNFFMGKRIRYSGWQDDSVLRVFRRDGARLPERRVHADVALISGKEKIAVNKMDHYTFTNFAHYMEKFDRYTTWGAADRGRVTKRVTFVHLVLRPAWRFFKQYILRFGFLDGLAGLIVCGLAAFSVFLKYAKLWERQQAGADTRGGETSK